MAITPREPSTRANASGILSQQHATTEQENFHFSGEETYASGHFVQFYSSDNFLINSVSSFLGAGLGAGTSCIFIGTPAHLAALEDLLEDNGLNLAFARTQKKYLALDAAETLAQFMVNGQPDSARFFEVIGNLIEHMAPGPQPVRIFGEMVAILHQEGKQDAAILLEALWNELSETTRPILLFCAYPIDSFAGEAFEEPFMQVCQQHTQIIPDESYTSLSTSEERLRAVSLLQQKAASLQAEVIERRKLEQQREAFLGLVTHELKNPLTALQGNVQIAQRLLTRLTRQTKNLLPGEQRMLQDVLTLLGRSQQQLHVQNRLINDLLTITYIEQDKLELFQTEVDLIRLIDETVRDFQAAYPSRRIETHLPEQDALVVYADRDRLQQVVSNFLTNALKFAPEHEPVEIGITPEARTIRVWVRDHGAGLAPEQQERIWQRFYQSPETRTQGEWKGGLGLGLYICYHLIHSQQGQIGVDSTPGDGATFWFTLPLYGS